MDVDAFIKVSSIQNICIHDGSGLRTTIFLKGCYLHCPWCCNPETISIQTDYFYNPEKCLYRKNIKSDLCSDCEIKGGKRAKEECRLGAYKPTYKRYTTDELFQLLLRDKYLYKESNGGITFSGGEPFLQAVEIKELLRRISEENINIAFETSLYCPHSLFVLLLPYINTFFVDLKLQFGFITNKEFNIDYTDDFLKNIRVLQNCRDKQIVYRYVFIPESIKDKKKQDNLIRNLSMLNIEHLEVLPYHTLAEKKYEQLNNSFCRFKIPSSSDISSLTTLLKNNNITYTVLKY